MLYIWTISPAGAHRDVQLTVFAFGTCTAIRAPDREYVACMSARGQIRVMRVAAQVIQFVF